MQKLVTVVLKIIPSMMNILFLFVVVVLVFACISMQLFSGWLINRCIVTSTINELNPGFNTETWLKQDFGEELYIYCNLKDEAKGMASMCPAGSTCVERNNPNEGMTGFDSFGLAALNVFEVFSMDTWGVLMYRIRNGKNYTFDVFFILCILVGAIFVINLVLAI